MLDNLNIAIHTDGRESLEEIKTDMKALRATTVEVQKDINNLKDAIQELGETLNKASPKRHTKAQKELAKQTKETSDAIRKETKDAKDLAKASEETAKSKEKAAKASKKQADAEEKAAKKARKAKKEADGLSGVMKELGEKRVPILGMKFKDLNLKAATLFTTITNLKKKLDSFRVASTFGVVGAVAAGLFGVGLSGMWRREDIGTGVRQGAYANGGYVGVITNKIVEAAQDLGKKFANVDPNQIAKAISAMMHPRLGYGIDDAKHMASLIMGITGATGTDAGFLSEAISKVLREYKIKSPDAETDLLQMFDVARKTGTSILDVAHYMADMAGVARRTGVGYSEMLTRAGQAWYAGADASTVYGAIYREAQALTDEYEGRYRESLETLRTSDVTDHAFKQAWYNLFQGDFPGLDKPGVMDFLRNLRTKQLWTHDIDSLVLEFASRQGYGFEKLYQGDTTYRQQLDTLNADIFGENPNAAILHRFSPEEQDAFNVMREALPESEKVLSHIDVTAEQIAEMRKNTQSTWDRVINAIKELLDPITYFVEGIFRQIVPKESREDLRRESLAEEYDVPYGERKPQKIELGRPGSLSQENIDKVIKYYQEKYPHGTVTFTDTSKLPLNSLENIWEKFMNPLQYISVDPLGKVMADVQDEVLTSAQTPTTPPEEIKNVPPLVNSQGTQTVVNNNTFNITGEINSLSDMTRNATIASRTTALHTGW